MRWRWPEPSLTTGHRNTFAVISRVDRLPTTAATLTGLSLSPDEASVFAFDTDGRTVWVFGRAGQRFTHFRLDAKK